MAAVDPRGGQKFWADGLPFEGVQKEAFDTRTGQFWFSGLPADYLFPASIAPPVGQPFFLRRMGAIYVPKIGRK